MPTSYEQFQERYEDDATREFHALTAMPVHVLLDRVRARQFGEYHQIWRAIGEKATLQQAAWTLLDVLRSDVEYLHRYHCANALIKLSGDALSGWTPVQLSAGKLSSVRDNLQKVQATIEAIIGQRPL